MVYNIERCAKMFRWMWLFHRVRFVVVWKWCFKESLISNLFCTRSPATDSDYCLSISMVLVFFVARMYLISPSAISSSRKVCNNTWEHAEKAWYLIRASTSHTHIHQWRRETWFWQRTNVWMPYPAIASPLNSVLVSVCVCVCLLYVVIWYECIIECERVNESRNFENWLHIEEAKLAEIYANWYWNTWALLNNYFVI